MNRLSEHNKDYCSLLTSTFCFILISEDYLNNYGLRNFNIEL